MKILFLPIDIDLAGLEFHEPQGHSGDTPNRWPFWRASTITQDQVQHNNFDKILDQLPLDRVTFLAYKTQIKPVGQHVDVHANMRFEAGEIENIRLNEPAGYRIVLSGSPDKLLVHNGQAWVTAELPSVPCCYLIHSTEGQHQVLDDHDRTLIYIRGFLNPERHQALVQRSLEKYSQYAVLAR